MDTLVLDQGQSTYLVNTARLVKTQEDVSSDLAASTTDEWQIDKANPFLQWIAGDFVEADNPNSNKQFWTAGDLELAEYTIKYSPLNMVHKFRTPIGFYAATKTVSLKKDTAAVLKKKDEAQGSMKIQALSALWTHIFPFEAAQAAAADEAGLLFYSMECRGTHLTCGSDEARGLEGCGQTFEYMQVDTHCEHLLERSSVRHIVNPTFRGGALIVPPVRPGWKNASASILEEAVMQEAASFAEQNERAYNQLNADGTELSASAWEHLMALIVSSKQ